MYGHFFLGRVDFETSIEHENDSNISLINLQIKVIWTPVFHLGTAIFKACKTWDFLSINLGVKSSRIWVNFDSDDDSLRRLQDIMTLSILKTRLVFIVTTTNKHSSLLYSWASCRWNNSRLEEFWKFIYIKYRLKKYTCGPVQSRYS